MTLVAAVPPAGAEELDVAAAGYLPCGDGLARAGIGPDGSELAEVAVRFGRFGPNALGTDRMGLAVLFLRIRNAILLLLLLLLLVAGLGSGMTGGGWNAMIIAVIVAAGVGLGFFNEYRAEMAMAALRAQIPQEADVRRDGEGIPGPVTDLVPGDVVSLGVVDLVPADVRSLNASPKTGNREVAAWFASTAARFHKGAAGARTPATSPQEEALELVGVNVACR